MHWFPRRRKRRLLAPLSIASFALALSTMGCTGVIEQDPNGSAENGAAGTPENPVIETPPGASEPWVDDGGRPLDPGRVTLSRLNRAEYNNTVRDLLGVELRPADDFPNDDFGYGYDNIADVLTMSPLHVELYELAAFRLIDEALKLAIEPVSRTLQASEMTATVGAGSGEFWNLWSNGEIYGSFDFPAEGTYKISIYAFQDQGGPVPANMDVKVDGRLIESVPVPALRASPQIYEVNTTLTGGRRVVAAEFTNDFYNPDLGEDRNLHVGFIRVEGPFDANIDASPSRALIITCDLNEADDESCAREILTNFARKAWRRPVTQIEVDRLIALKNLAIAEGEGIEEGIRLALSAVLISPNFLFRIELDEDHQSATPRFLNDHELAARLSYFLWSSMPDEELFALADEGRLQDDGVLKAQVQRMLDDAKAEALTENFAGQWLYIRAIRDAAPDYNVFRSFDDTLREAMIGEAQHFFRDFLTNDHPVHELLTANFTYVNERLASHYDIPGIEGNDFQRIELSDAQRGGLLTQAGILTVTSFPTRTSPVNRGAWVLGHLLCAEPPAPPPEVEAFTEEETPTETLRERFARHSSDPSCSVCHAMMDPIGFGLENYDGVGAWREEDRGGFPIDSAGELPGGHGFSGAQELAALLADHPAYVPCIVEQLMTYGLGRGMAAPDAPMIVGVTERVRERDYRFRAVIEEIALSPAFRMRRGEPGGQ